MRQEKGALFNTDKILKVDQNTIALLKSQAPKEPLLRYRLCLHQSPNEPVQEMIIAACRESYSAPHRHPGRSMSYHILEGQIAVYIFEANGKLTEVIELDTFESGKTFCFRLCDSQWYMPVVKSEIAVYYEVLSGPNPDGTATEYAQWAPAGNDKKEVDKFMKSLAK